MPETETPISTREITSIAEMRAVEEIQKEVWGIPDLDVVPYSHLVASVAAGGVLLGAFDKEIMAGFVYGFVSFERGQIAHHSHMLAIKPEYRSRDLGTKLKLAQRDFVLKQGITLMSWTFDPLQSLNAYFNFKKLGVFADTYFIDFYGDNAPSFLHQNSTDRLWITWDLRREFGDQEKPPDPNGIVRLVRLGTGNVPQFEALEQDFSGKQVGIEIPADINRLQSQDHELAKEWREATRQAFTSAFEKGYVVREFHRMDREGQLYGLYLLDRK